MWQVIIVTGFNNSVITTIEDDCSIFTLLKCNTHSNMWIALDKLVNTQLSRTVEMYWESWPQLEWKW